MLGYDSSLFVKHKSSSVLSRCTKGLIPGTRVCGIVCINQMNVLRITFDNEEARVVKGVCHGNEECKDQHNLFFFFGYC